MSQRHNRSAGMIVLAGLVAALFAGPVAMAGRSPVTQAAAPKRTTADLARALLPDGTFLGSAGVTGAVDTSAWTLVSDLASGERPRFAPAHVALSTPVGPWSALGSNGSGNGAINGSVYAIAVSGTDLYVGGNFTNAAGNAKADYVARWNGSSWSALGSNGAGDGALNSRVFALAVSGTNLFVGGLFTNAAGKARADYVARWNGAGWFAMGSNGSGDGAIDTAVYALAVSGTNLYVGGDFTNAANIAEADFVAMWDGSAWSALGSNGGGDGALTSTVEVLAVSGTDLYVGGDFSDAAGIAEADFIARWNGSWSALGSNGAGIGALNSSVYALAVSGTNLYVGGDFTNARGIQTADYVARWNGGDWSALGSNGSNNGALNYYLNGVAVSGSNVFVGGHFTDAAGNPTADSVAMWNGSTWSAMGSNGSGNGALNDSVQSLRVVGTNLYVGGDFTNAAGLAKADYIAKWILPILRADGRIRLGSGTLVGNNVYNTTGVNQTRTGSATPGHTITFGISIQNDGNGADRFKLKATGTAMSGYAVKYFRGATDITAAVVAGTYQTPSLAPTATYLVTAKVTVKSAAASGSQVARLVTLTSVGNSTRKDAVRFFGKRA